MTNKKKTSFHEADGWTEVSPATEASSWEKGTVVVGTFEGLNETSFENEDGSKAMTATFENADGTFVYWTPAILKNRLSSVPVGTEVRVECMGKIRTRSGRQAWDFTVHRRNA